MEIKLGKNGNSASFLQSITGLSRPLSLLPIVVINQNAEWHVCVTCMVYVQYTQTHTHTDNICTHHIHTHTLFYSLIFGKSLFPEPETSSKSNHHSWGHAPNRLVGLVVLSPNRGKILGVKNNIAKNKGKGKKGFMLCLYLQVFYQTQTYWKILLRICVK